MWQYLVQLYRTWLSTRAATGSRNETTSTRSTQPTHPHASLSGKELHALYPDLYQEWYDQGYKYGQLAEKRKKPQAQLPDNCTNEQCQLKKQYEGQIRNLRHNVDQLKAELKRVKRMKGKVLTPTQRYNLGLPTRKKGFRSRAIASKNAREGFCIYCGADAYTYDHLTPKSRGGSSAPDNIAPACVACNQEKGNMTYEEYLTWRKYHRPY